MSNRLKNETSPYLLQHAENPVEWYSWCDEAFKKAKSENKPIFLSIGYSTCHWCHVMAHESFEDDYTAKILNENFISIKVDREERPDIDSVYMSVCQALTGSGGWPMSIFMTWDKKPFYAGTYFPVKARYGMPSFSDLLNAIISKWNENKNELLTSADKIIDHLNYAEDINNDTDVDELTQKAVIIFKNTFDGINGGFGSAPKFPTPHNLLFLLMYAKINKNSEILKMAEKTLVQMRKGGIFDHIGYGFSRYSTDKYYLAPHFEKMLYDNALLIIAYASAYSMTNNNLYLDTAEKTAKYILREMTSDDGGFYSAQDADSDGVEGKYYTFTFDEIIKVLGVEKGKEFSKTFDITEKGNFEGVNIPNLLKSNAFDYDFKEEIEILYGYRKKRNKLHLDDKILLSWNSLMIAAMSILYRITNNVEYLNFALKAQSFIEQNLCEGLQLYTSFRDEKHSEKGFLDDYAFYIASLIELYNSTLDKSFLNKAEDFLNESIKRFWDAENGGFHLCETKNTEHFLNPKESYDGAIPSGNSVMTYNLVRLYQLTENREYEKFLKKQIEYMLSQVQNYPAGHSMFLLATLLSDNPPEHITVVLKDGEELDNLRDHLPLLANISVVREGDEYKLVNNKTTYYVCKNNNCMPPKNYIE